MKAKLVAAAVLLCISAPSFGQRLYVVQGPLASQTPAPVFKGDIDRPMFSTRSNFLLLKSWTLANGEVLNGKCNLVIASSANMKPPGTPESYPPQPNLAYAWDLIKGSGFYVSHVLGNKIAQGLFTGDKGTVLQVESVDNNSGVAVDNRGDIFKIVW